MSDHDPPEPDFPRAFDVSPERAARLIEVVERVGAGTPSRAVRVRDVVATTGEPLEVVKRAMVVLLLTERLHGRFAPHHRACGLSLQAPSASADAVQAAAAAGAYDGPCPHCGAAVDPAAVEVCVAFFLPPPEPPSSVRYWLTRGRRSGASA